jgi:Uma2 family endonuclease
MSGVADMGFFLERNDFSCTPTAIQGDTIPMATAALIPVSEYLSSTYEPDCDYIEGELQERNVGETAHSFVQSILVALFNTQRRPWSVVAGTEMRVQAAPNRFRVPDVCVQRRSDPHDPIIQAPPLICVEVLSPEDRLYRMSERIADYTRMGVAHIWLIDPLSRKAWIATPDGSLTTVHEAFTIPNTPIRVVLAEVFAELDDMLTQA